MLKKLYDKSPIWSAIVWIIAYCVLMSLADALSEKIGTDKILTLPIGILLCTLILIFLKKNKLFEEYGLCRSKVPARSMLYYLPLIIMLSANLWLGVRMNCGPAETVLYILSMFCVGFLEEIIFRGFLFNAMLKDSPKAAVIVSSLTFGIGHIINLINGSGAELIPNLLQVIYASAAGFMFVAIYYKSKSLIVCIITHALFNALSVFANEAGETLTTRIVTCVLLTLITLSYAFYIALTMRKKNN